MKKHLLLFISFLLLCASPIYADVSEGYYVLIPKCASSKAVTINGGSKKAKANAFIQGNSGAAKQVFLIKKLSDGTYTITNKNSGLVLEASGTKNKSNVRQNQYSGNARQKWKITKNGSVYVIKNAASGKALSVKGNKNKNKTNVFINKYSGKSGQVFALKMVSSTNKDKTKDAAADSVLDSEDEIIKFLESDFDDNGSADISDTDIVYFDSDDDGASGFSYSSSSRNWKESDYTILTNIIGAVESGGQVYGNRDYAAYAGPGTSTSNEVTITLGWAQYYGSEGQRLIREILKKDEKTFRSIDKNHSIEKALSVDWVSTGWNPTSAQRATLIALITSEPGKKCQDELFKTYMQTFVADCARTYTSNAWAVFMYCEIRHLGGPSAVARIFNKCKARNSYSLNTIMAALKEDQSDPKSNAQVGDQIFWSRHVKCCEFIEKYAK